MRDATFLQRGIAWFIDQLPITFAFFVLAWVVWPGFAETVTAYLADSQDPYRRAAFLGVRNVVRDTSWLAYLAMCTAFEATGQSTPGKRLMGLSVVTADGTPIGAGAALARNVTKLLSIGCCFLGLFWSLFDAKGATLHDRAAGGTRVVHLP